ncbi:hypothetical protein K2173_021569 [Erythroxylum novogranatense]|uniref:Uncharacterized protein n=1 Tax=Erythroxylum novogranatense TaxID=1862640 RepID=A0AAV8TNA0_9ROSI|nr:hypothetical protein K2173_021569 [Erythroxylum novogranatense]
MLSGSRSLTKVFFLYIFYQRLSDRSRMKLLHWDLCLGTSDQASFPSIVAFPLTYLFKHELCLTTPRAVGHEEIGVMMKDFLTAFSLLLFSLT